MILQTKQFDIGRIQSWIAWMPRTAKLQQLSELRRAVQELTTSVVFALVISGHGKKDDVKKNAQKKDHQELNPNIWVMARSARV